MCIIVYYCNHKAIWYVLYCTCTSTYMNLFLFNLYLNSNVEELMTNNLANTPLTTEQSLSQLE